MYLNTSHVILYLNHDPDAILMHKNLNTSHVILYHCFLCILPLERII